MVSVRISSIRQMAVSLRDARFNAGITQTELSKRTGIPRQWINRLEQGEIPNASVQRLIAISNALKTTITFTYEVAQKESSSLSSDETQEQADSTLPSAEETADALQAALHRIHSQGTDAYLPSNIARA